MMYWKLYWTFFKIGLFSVGGGYASMPLIQQEIVYNNHWLTMADLVNILTISQMTPGPIGINAATFVGTKILGVGGAIVTTAGFVTPSVLIMISLAKVYEKYREVELLQSLLRGLRPAVVALILSAGIAFLGILGEDAGTGVGKEVAMLVVALVLLRKTRLGAISVMGVMGALALILELLF